MAVAMKQKKITQKVLNRALAENGQPAIEFARILLPGETISDWMDEFRKANQGGYLLNETKAGMRGNDQELIYVHQNKLSKIKASSTYMMLS